MLKTKLATYTYYLKNSNHRLGFVLAAIRFADRALSGVVSSAENKSRYF
jgi:hypothetical protein